MKKRLLSLIPHKKVEVTTSLSIDEVVDLFSNSISPEWDPIWQTPPKNIRNIQGEISDKGFQLGVTRTYISSYIRAYRKITDFFITTYLIGKFIPNERGTKIEMYLTGFPYLIIPLFICIILFLLIDLVAIPDDESIVISVALLAMAFLFFIGEADQLDFHVSNILEKYILKN